MTVKETFQGVGVWSVRLDPATPAHVLNKTRIESSGRAHVVITTAWADLGGMPDEDALALARYTGIYLKRVDETLTLSGHGMNGWLGDGSIGPTTGGTSSLPQSFSAWATRCTPANLGVGIRSTIAGTWAKDFGLSYLRDIADGVADAFNAAWRVTNDGKLDFGTFADLFREDPIAVIVRHRADSGRDLGVRGLTGDLAMMRDVEDTPRRVIYRWDNAGTPTDYIQTGGIADADYPFRSFDGSPMFIDKLIDDSKTTTVGDATRLSAAQLASVAGVRSEFTLTSSEYDIGRDVAVGDNVMVFDLARGVYDMANDPLVYRGQTIYPRVLRCVGYTWPIRQGMGVWLRRWVKPSTTWELEWVDLTPYVIWEDGDTTVDVGAKPRAIL